MLELITDAKEIRHSQQRLQRLLVEHLSEKDEFLLGYPGGSFYNDVHFSRARPVWYSTFLSDEKDRWVNLFGKQSELALGRSNSIVVECNPPAEGIDRRSAGVFLREPGSGLVFFGHRGRLAGGRPGVGKRSFRRWYKGNWQPFLDDDGGGERTGEVVVISDLTEGGRLLQRIEAFVIAAEAYKVAIIEGQVVAANTDENAEYSPEFAGEKQIPARTSLVAACDHGFVVEAVREWICAKHPGVEPTNNGQPDLVAQIGKRRVLVEVKTDGSTSCVYTGVGQLMVYGLTVQPTERWLVIPAEDVADWRSPMQALGIKIVGYERRGKRFAIVADNEVR